MVKTETFFEEMDAEWMALILEAKLLGISKETVRDFLGQNEVKELSIENH